MSDPYIGEIRMFGGSFAPAGWAFCNGALMPISENEALFTLIGTTYGGDGQETFALPDLQGRVPIHSGQGPGISQSYQLGEEGGVESVTLTTNQIPTHNHPLLASSDPGNKLGAENNVLSRAPAVAYTTENDLFEALSPQAVTPQGGSQPHENMQPFLCVSFIISLFGIFPQQN